MQRVRWTPTVSCCAEIQAIDSLIARVVQIRVNLEQPAAVRDLGAGVEHLAAIAGIPHRVRRRLSREVHRLTLASSNLLRHRTPTRA